MLTPADTYGADELAALFTAAYEGYWFPVQLDGAAFTAMIGQSDVELGASRVALDGGRPVGIVLLGVRGGTGWIGGMGVVPALRRRGLGEALMRAVLDEARARGLREVTLEVLEQNEPAIRLYERLGFEPVRELEVWTAQAAGAASTAVPVDVDDAHAWIAAARTSPEPWQRADRALAWLRLQDPPPVALAVEDGGSRRGAAVIRVAVGRAGVIQLAAADERAAGDLLAGILASAGSLLWLNAVAGDGALPALRALGGTVAARQHELALAL